MSNSYKIELGIGLNQSQLNTVKQVLESIEKQERKVEYNVDFNIRNLDKLKSVSEEIKGIQSQLNKGKSKDALSIDTSKVEKSLGTIHEDIKKLQNAFGKVDSKKGVQSLLTTVNKISVALEKVSKQFEGLNKNLTNLSSKDLSLNFDFGLGKSGKDPEQAAKELQMLKREVEEYEKYFRRLYSLEGRNEDPINRLILNYNQRSQVYGLQLRDAMTKGNDVQKIAAHKEFLRLIKETASIGNIALEPVEFRLAESGEFVKVRNEANETEKKLKELFSGGIDAENLQRTLSEIADDLNKIKQSLIGIDSEADSSINKLVQSFNRLSESVEKFVQNATLAKNVLGDSLGGSASIDTGAINKVEKISDNSTAAIIQNEKKKQEAYRETADTIQKVSKITPMDGQLVNIMSSNIRDAAQKAGIDLENYYRSLQDVNAFQLTNADVAAIADASEPIVNQLGIESYSGYIKKMREIANTVVQEEEKKQQAIKETANVQEQADNRGQDEISQAQKVANEVTQAEEKKQQAYKETRKLISDSAQEAIDKVSSQSIDKAFVVDEPDSIKFRREMENLVSQWTDAKGKLTDIKINTQTFYDGDTGRNIEKITSAIVTYNNELGETIKKTIALRQIDTKIDVVDGNEMTSPVYGFVEVSGQYSKSLGKTKAQTDAFVKQQKKSVADLTNTINQLNRAATDKNAARPIKLSSHLTSLANKYDEITAAIQRMESASSDTFVDEQNNVRRLISEFKSLVSEYRNADNVSTKMKGTDLTSGVNIALNDFKKFKSDAKDYPQLVGTINKLRNALNEVGDASSLNKFNDQLRIARSELAKIKSETTAANRSEKVGINVSGLESKIADLQRISPQIDKFETEIDGAKVSVQSLLNDLKQINTQGDFSVVNSRFKAFVDSAKAAGIAVTETAQKAKSINDIKIKISDTGFDGFKQEVLRVHNAVEELECVYPDLEASLKRLDTAMEDVYSADQAGDVKRLVAANEEYEASLKQVYSQLKLYQQTEQKAYKAEMLKQKKSALSSEMETWLKENTRAARDFGDEIRRLQSSLNGLDDKGVKLVAQQFKGITKQAQAMGKTGLTAFDKLKTKAKEYMTYLSAAEMFMYAEQALRSMFEQVKLIDSAMTGLYRVTDLTAAEYNSLFNDMISSAKEYGATLTDVINATTDWVRAGFNANTSLGLAEVTTMYQHISDLDYDTAAENLITAYNGFKDELNGAFDGDTVGAVNYIADILNELDNNYAATSAGIGEALTRSASALDLAGNSIQETAGMITGIIEVTQDPEQAGSTLKILSLRLRGMKGQLEELGEETDENVENISKMQGQILNLTNGKVNIFDGAGEFRSTYEIMKDISEVWDDLNSTAQADLLETIAGKHRANSVAALMSNWENVEAAVKSATEAEGSAARENAKYVDSIQGRLDKMTTSWQSFANTFMSSDFLKGGISFITNLIENFEKLIDTVGSFPALIGTVAAGISLFKNQGIFKALNTDLDGFLNNIGIAKKSFADLINSFNFGKSGGGLKGGLSAIKNSLSNGLTKSDIANIQAYNQEIRSGTSAQTAWYRTMQTSSEAAQNMVAAAKGGEVALNGMKTATLKSKIAMIGAKAAAIAFNTALTMGISLLIDFAISGIMKVVNAEKELAEKVEELTSKFKEQHDELKKLKSDYDTTNESSMISKYEKLSKGVDNLGRNVSLTSEEYSEYQSIVNSIADQIPSLVTGYDAQGNALLSVKGNVEELTKAYEKLIHAQNQEILTNTGDIEDDFANSIKDKNSQGWWQDILHYMSPTKSESGVLWSIMTAGTGGVLPAVITELSDYKMTTDAAKALEDLLNTTDIKERQKKIENLDSMTSEAIEAALKNAGIDVGFMGLNTADALEKALENEPQKIRGIIDNHYSQFSEAINKQKTIAQAKLSEAFDVSDAISGLNYGNISEELQSLAYQTVNSLDVDFFTKLQESGKSVEQWTTEMLDQLNAISKEDSDQIGAAFDLQTKFNGGEISFGEYIDRIENVSDLIDDLNLKDEVESQLKLSLGLNEDGLVEEYQTLLNRLTETDKNKISTGNVIGLGLEEAKEFLDSLSSDKLSVVNNAVKDFKPISADEIKAEFDKFEEGGSVDLALRPQVDTSVLKDAGWENIGEGVATVFTSTFSNAAGDVAMNFTPIMTDENGKHIGTLSPEELQKYAESVIDGTIEDGLKLQIGAKFEGDDAIAQAESVAERIHQLQDYYYNGTSVQLQAAIDRMMAVQGLTFDLNLEVETAGIESLNTALEESVSATGLSSESIDALKSRYSELESEGYNLSAMFEETSNGIHLNKKAVNELEQAYVKQKKSDIDEKLGKLQKEYELVAQDIENCNDASERAALYVQRDAIIQQINDASTLAAQYEGLASAYNAWLSAEDAGSERDMYEKIIEGFETVKDEISRGWIDDGTIKFLELLTGRTDLASKSGKELKEIYDDLDNTIKHTGYSISDFFTVDDDGNSTNTGVYNFLDAIGQLEEEAFSGLDVVKRDGNGNIIGFDFELVAQKDENGNVIKNGDQVIAEALGISEELVQIMVRAADDAGFVVNLEGAYTQLADLKTEAETARDVLISLKKDGLDNLKDTDVNFDLNAEGDDLVAEQEKVVKLLDKFKKDGKLDLSINGAQEALEIAEYLTIKVDDLTEPKYMQIDTSTIEEDLQEPIEKMQEFERLSKEKHLLTLTGDTESLNDVNAEMDKIAEYLDNIKDEETQVKLGIKGLSKEEIAEKLEKGEIELNAELNVDVQMSDDLKDMRLMMMNQLGLVSDAEVKLKIGYDIDESVVNGLTEEQKEVVVKYLADDEGIEEYTPEEKEAIVKYVPNNEEVEKWSPEEKKAFAKYLVDGGSVEEWSPEAKNAFVKYLVDGGDPKNFNPENKDSWVVYGVDSTEIDNFTLDPITGSAIFTPSLGVFPSTGTLTPPTIYGGKVFYNPQLSGSFQSQSNSPRISEVNGTANVNGTTGRAFKQGSWGTKSSGTALVGEVGREVLVRDGKYYTIGDTGAEFIKYKKGDIIFNHVQSEQLFKNGKVTAGGGRAKAFVNGTAFEQGTDFVGGSSGIDGGLGKITQDVSAIRKETEKSSGSKGSDGGTDKNKDGKAVGGKTKSSSSSSSSSKEKEFEETVDWVEVALSRIEREIDNLDKKAGNVYKSWSSRNKALTQEISKVGDEIGLQQLAYDRYIKEANSIGLSSSWAKKVRNGTIDISTIKDEGLAEKIKNYKTWYEKAIACQYAIEELREQESKLYSQRFENIQTQYDGILQGYEHTESMLNEYISQAEEQGHLVSTKYYDALINNEKQNIAELKKEQADLIAERDNAVDSGKITKYSEAWYEQCAAIDDVTQAIESGTTALLEYAKAIDEINWQKFDLIQERISDVTAESEFLIELMSNKDLFDDNGKLTGQGAATMGLHALNYNTSMYQVDDYGKEIAKLDKQIKSDPYDQELINRRRELVELQREMILEAENSKNAIKDLVEDGINLELDALSELIDKKNEELEAEKD